MRERIGLLGGSFNPIHLGHLAMARAAREALGLDRVLLMPDGSPPHKSRGLADRHDRLAMVRLAAQDEFEVSDMETERPGKTYTVDTLEALRAQWPEAELWMIIGGDTLGEIGGWKRAERVFSLCRFAAFRREGLPFPQPPEGAEVTPLSAAIPPISATAIRARIHKGLGLEGWTPSAVEDYIGARRLYDPPEQLSGKAMRKRLAATLPKKRMVHVEGVEAVIRALARRWGADEKKAALAALLHDCAKGMDLPAMLAWADRWEVPLDSLRRTSTPAACAGRCGDGPRGIRRDRPGRAARHTLPQHRLRADAPAGQAFIPGGHDRAVPSEPALAGSAAGADAGGFGRSAGAGHAP